MFCVNFCAVVRDWKGGLLVLCENGAKMAILAVFSASFGFGRCFLTGRFGGRTGLSKGRSLVVFWPQQIEQRPLPLAARSEVCFAHWPKPIFTCFATELNDGQRTSKMARWKATSKGFPTGYRRDPSAVVKINRGSLENLYQKQILYQKQMNPS